MQAQQQSHQSLYRENALKAAHEHRLGKTLVLPKLRHSVLSAFILIWVATACWFLTQHEFTEKTTVSGYISANKPSISISPKEASGIVHEVLVTNGQHVKKGQAVVVIRRANKVLLDTDFSHTHRQLVKDQILSLKELNNAKINELINQKQALLMQAQNLEDSLKRILGRDILLEEQITLLSEEHVNLMQLAEKNLISRHQHRQLKQQLLSKQQEQVQLNDLQAETHYSLQQLKIQHAQIEQQIQQVEARSKQEESRLQQAINELNKQELYTLYAPFDGVISNLHVLDGADLAHYPVLFKVTPVEQQLRATLAIPASTGGLVAKGQTLRIRLNAFPYQKYGMLNASLEQIERTILLPNETRSHPLAIQEPVFLAQADLPQDFVIAHGDAVKLKEGMSLQADVILSRRSLFEWLMAPLYSIKGEL
uniref:HlyD family secretion protein n=1 Tax=Ningiella ruwaisensis TaxID=2364274 RepID=UPI00109FCFF0|nr:HlyD family efflux transporter periplasmic adaptor subunit [Ningiella ruwaisensis]